MHIHCRTINAVIILFMFHNMFEFGPKVITSPQKDYRSDSIFTLLVLWFCFD